MNLRGYPEHGFVAYVDEAGDPGLKRVRPIDKNGSTEWFVISAVVVGRTNEPHCESWVKQINQRIGVNHDHVIKFTSLNGNQKLAACQEMASLPIQIFIIASNKKNMRATRTSGRRKWGLNSGSTTGWFEYYSKE